MRHRFVLALLLALCVAVTVALPTAGPTTVKPTLRFATTTTPVKLLGTHFGPYERVRVTGLVSAVRVSRSATATAAGAFTITFGPSVSLQGCRGPVSILAVGDQGSRAILKLFPRLCSELAP